MPTTAWETGSPSWSSDTTLGGTLGSDYDLLTATSADSGVTWTSPEMLNSLADVDAGDDTRPQIATNGAGVWVTVWDSDEDLGGVVGTDLDVFRAAAMGPDTDGDGLSDGEEDAIHGTDPFDPDTDGDGFDDGEEILGGSDPLDPNSTPLGVSDPSDLNTNATSDAGDDVRSQVATDGDGVWVAVWHSTEDLSGMIGTDSDIFFARSTDAGASWSAPAALNTNADSDTGLDFIASVAADGDGNWVVVWYSNDTLGGSVGADFDIFFARSTDDGQTWSAPAALNTNADSDSGADAHPQVAADGAGGWVVVWDSNDSLGGSIGTDLDILYARSTDDGASWSAPAAVHDNAVGDSGHDRNPHVNTDSDTTWVVAWQSTENLNGNGSDSDIFFVRSTDSAVTWSSTARLNVNAGLDSGGDFAPHVMPGAPDRWLAVWYSQENLSGSLGTDNDIFLARSFNGGQTWTSPVAINVNADRDDGDDFNPRIATDGAGNWAAVWYSASTLDGTLGSDFDILWARSIDGGATWFDPSALDEAAETDTGDDYFPDIATDGLGDWVAVWDSNDTQGGTVGSDHDIILVQGSGPDRDGDGLIDGVEANVYGTNPALFDTDGDGIGDGAEVAAGTDPNDPNDPIAIPVPTLPPLAGGLVWLLLTLAAWFQPRWRESVASSQRSQ